MKTHFKDPALKHGTSTKSSTERKRVVSSKNTFQPDCAFRVAIRFDENRQTNRLAIGLDLCYFIGVVSEQIAKQGLKILDYFFRTDQNMTPSEIAVQFGLEIGVAKYHLSNLLAAGWLAGTRNWSELNTTGNTRGFVITDEGRSTIMLMRNHNVVSI